MRAPQTVVRDRLLAADGLASWLGDPDGFVSEPGTPFETADSTTGEVRTVAPGERLRLT